MKEWYGTELTKTEAELFKKYLLEHDIPYEASEVYHLTHFECCMTEDEVKDADEWILENIEER